MQIRPPPPPHDFKFLYKRLKLSLQSDKARCLSKFTTKLHNKKKKKLSRIIWVLVHNSGYSYLVDVSFFL